MPGEAGAGADHGSAATPAACDVWWVDPDAVPDAQADALAAAVLSSDERVRRDRFRFARDRHAFVVTRALVRRVLSRHAPVEPAAWTFGTGPHGRPEVDAPAVGGAPLRFNVTHTRGFIACAVTRGLGVGIDAEHLDRRVATTRLATRYFAEAEARAVADAPPAERSCRFFETWTLKEAYVKARGLGLGLALGRFAVLRDDDGTLRLRLFGMEDDVRWRFWLLRPAPRHVLGVALEDDGRPAAVSLRPALDAVAP